MDNANCTESTKINSMYVATRIQVVANGKRVPFWIIFVKYLAVSPRWLTVSELTQLVCEFFTGGVRKF